MLSFNGRVSSIYNTWEEVKDNILGYSGVVHRRFSDLKRAKAIFIDYQGENDIKKLECAPKESKKVMSKAHDINVPIHIYFASVIGVFFLGMFSTLVILYFGK